MIISSDGYVLTNRHVIMNATSVEAKLMRQQELSSLVRRGRLKELTGGGKRGKARHTAKSYCPGCGGGVAAKMAYCPQCGGKLK